MGIYNSLKERIFCLPGACALSAAFIVYLGPFQYPFRHKMLTVSWMKCLRERGLPLVFDSISPIRGRVVKWKMASLAHFLAHTNEIYVPDDDCWQLQLGATFETELTESLICKRPFS